MSQVEVVCPICRREEVFSSEEYAEAEKQVEAEGWEKTNTHDLKNFKFFTKVTLLSLLQDHVECLKCDFDEIS